MAGQVVQAQRTGFADEQPQHPMPTREVADRVPASRGQAFGHELDQVLAIRPDNPHRPVPGVDELAGRVHDSGEHLRQVQPGGHRHHRVEKSPQTMLSPLVVQRTLGGHTTMLRPKQPPRADHRWWRPSRVTRRTPTAEGPKRPAAGTRRAPGSTRPPAARPLGHRRRRPAAGLPGCVRPASAVPFPPRSRR